MGLIRIVIGIALFGRALLFMAALGVMGMTAQEHYNFNNKEETDGNY